MTGQAKKILRKMIVVVFLTLMIWIWADLETEEKIPITGIPLRIAKSPDPALRADFMQSADRLSTEIRINTISLRGPSARIQEIRRMEEDGTLDLQLSLIPQAESIAAPSASNERGRVPGSSTNPPPVSHSYRKIRIGLPACENLKGSLRRCPIDRGRLRSCDRVSREDPSRAARRLRLLLPFG